MSRPLQLVERGEPIGSFPDYYGSRGLLAPVGCFAQVYLASDRYNDEVVVKLCTDPVLADLDNEINQLEEYKDDPGVVDVLDIGEHRLEDGNSLPFVVMEYVEGGSLCRRVEENPNPDKKELRSRLHIVQGVVGAVALLHAEGKVYGDMKPDNILVNKYGDGVICDLGTVSCPKTGGFPPRYTPDYSSPEVINGVVSTTNDIFGIGVTLQMISTGRKPWSAVALRRYAHSIQQGHPEIPDVVNDDTPEQLRGLILECTSENPENRPPAEEIYFRLQQLKSA